MYKTLRFLVKLIISLIIIAIATAIALVIFIKPNDYKTQIAQKVSDYTGRTLTLNGDISWSLFPWLGLQINQAELSNAPGFGPQPFAKVDQIDVKVKLLPLLKERIEVGTLILNGLNLNLAKNKQGVSNWQDLVDRLSHSSAKQTQTANDPAPSSTSTTHKFYFAIAAININDGNISWQDQQLGNTYKINNVQLQSKNIKTAQPFPVNLKFDFQSNNPALAATTQITTQATINPNTESYNLDALNLSSALTGKSLPGGKLTISSQGQLMITPQQQNLTLTQLTADAMNTHITGNLQAQQLFSIPSAQGKLTADHFQQGSFYADDVNAQFNLHDKQLAINPITAKLYQGKYTGNINVDMRTATPRISTDTQLSNIQVAPLFADLKDITHLQVTGLGNLNAHLTMQGSDTNAIVRTLNGNGNFSLNNGVVKGINLSYWLAAGRALVNRQTPPPPSSVNETNFGNIKGTFTASNGVIQNNDLLGQMPNVQTTGNGFANLVTQMMKYQLNIQPVSSTNQPNGIAIPLIIEGSFASPSIHPDTTALLKNIAKDELSQHKQQVEQRINDVIDKNVGKDLGDQLKKGLAPLFQ